MQDTCQLMNYGNGLIRIKINMLFTKLYRKRIINSPKEVNKLIYGIKKYGLVPICIGIGAKYNSFNQFLASEDGDKFKGFSNNILLEQTDTKLKITSKYGPELLKPCTYIFDLNGREDFAVSGLDTFTQFSRYWKIPKAKDYKFDKLDKFFDEETGKYICSVSPIIGFNKAYEEKELLNCYEYDINSAYFNTLLNKVPDLENPMFNTRVKYGQVGFILDDKLPMIIGEKNRTYLCDVVFNLIPTPAGIKEYYTKWYTAKQNAKNKIAKLTAKAYLNLPIGYSQRYNPFLRAYVVNSCNRTIFDLIAKVGKSNCLIWNTDAIITTKEVDDCLAIGSEIGQFKKIICNKFKYKGNNYQINEEIPTYRGIPKEWFTAFERKNKRAFNLLIDEIPSRCNRYYLDWDNLSLKENDFNE